MKVAIDVSAIPARPAGAGTYVLRVVEALVRLGEPELVLVSRRDDGERWRRLAPGTDVRAAAPRPRPLRLAWEQVVAPVVGRQTGADVWHGPHYTMPLMAGRPAVVTIHDLTFFDHPEWHEPSKVAYFRRMIGLAVRRAAVLICVSDRTARDLRARFEPTCPVLVAAHGVDHARFHPDGDADADRQLLAALGIDGPYVAFNGTIEPRKNIPSLVRAMEALPADVSLALTGQDGWGTDAVDAAIAASTRRVIRLGYVADEVLPALFRQAGVVAYPAFDEGFGLPVLEALACGARVVTTSGTPMEEVSVGAALIVPPGDDGALGAALVDALAGRGPDPKRGPVVAGAFTWQASARIHVEAYRLACDS